VVEVLRAVWVGAVVGAFLKVLSPHPNWQSSVLAALVGGFGATVGLFISRLLGVAREREVTTLAVAGGIAAIVVVIYAWISDIAVRRIARRAGRITRPPYAF